MILSRFSSHQIKWLGLILLVAMWGSAFAAMNIAVREVPPFWLAAARLWIGAAFVSMVLVARRESLPTPAAAPAVWRAYVLVGVIGTALPFILFAWGAAHTKSALLGISNGASPIFTALFTVIFIPAERLTRQAWLGVLAGFAGLLCLVGPQAWAALRGLAGEMSLLLGMLAGIAGAFCYSAANIITRRAPALHATAAAVIFCTTGALAATLIAFVTTPLPGPVSPRALLMIAALGIFPSGLASILYVWIVRAHGPVFASLATYLTPLWATAMGVLLLRETLGLNAFAALVLILAGVAIASRSRAQ